MLGSNYEDVYKLSISQPEKIWDELAKEVIWTKPYTSVIKNEDSPIPIWFDGGEINMSYNCLDKHVLDGYGDDVAIIYECTLTHTSERMTYQQLLTLVEHLAGVMVNKCHVRKGDRVLLYFPVTIQGVAAMLACTRIGAVYVVIFSSLEPDLIAEKLTSTEPKLVITTNIGYEPGRTIKYKEHVEDAIKLSQFIPDYCLVYNRLNTDPAKMVNGKDLDWETEIKTATPHAAVPLESNHPMYIIYTSGTTGEPKALVMGTGNSIVTDKYFLKYVGGVERKDCFWMFSDFGWISGQTLMTYGPLLVGCTMILYEGKPLTKEAMTEVAKIINRHNVAVFGSMPTFFRIMKKLCLEADIKLPYKQLKGICIGGETSNAELRQWISKIFSSPIHNVWGQSELGPLVTGYHYGYYRPNYDESMPNFSINPKIINSKTEEQLPNGTVGRIILKTPISPSAALTIYKDHQKYLDLFFTKYPGYFDTMDYGMLNDDGSLQVLSRSESIIEISSTYICGGVIEEVCLQNEYLLNAAVVPLDDPVTGQVPIAFLEVKNDKPITNNEVIENIIELVTKKLGDFVCFKNAVIVPELPKNRAGKLLRYSLLYMANGKQWTIPVNVEKPHVFKEIYDVLINAGYKPSLPLEQL